jgi:glycosyltransferase involved in cell wall biosynthesis
LQKKNPSILLVLWPSPSKQDIIVKKISEITVKMDKSWKIYALKGNLTKFNSNLGFSCTFEFHPVFIFGSSKSLISRLSYFINCVRIGLRLVKNKNIQLIMQHDGHLEYGLTAFLISKLTNRKCLIRVNEDTLIPIVYFLQSLNNRLFGSKFVVQIVSLVYRRMERCLFEKADWIVTHGPMDYRKISQFTDKITFIPLWVDESIFHTISEPLAKNFMKDLGISNDQKVILFIGRLHPEKGLDTLLRALKLIENQNFLLLIVYSLSEYKGEYVKLASSLNISDKVRFVGYIPNSELINYYNIASVYVLPSIREEWSNTIMEAMACKTPIIATNVGGNPYMILEGKSGFLVPPNDPQALATKIKYVFDNSALSEKVAEYAATTIKEYNKDKIGEKYKSVIANLVE